VSPPSGAPPGLPGPSAGAEPSGRVATFDAEVGLGSIEADDGRLYPFHCVAVADGTRRIEPGSRVRFRVTPGPPGRWEAADIRPEGPVGAAGSTTGPRRVG
jgi:cold shock CspA family protein